MNILEKWFGPNWRTTLMGAVTGLGMIINECKDYLDSNPDTILEPLMIVTGLGLIFGFKMARDKKVSSEESGIPGYRTGPGALANYQRKTGTGGFGNNDDEGMA